MLELLETGKTREEAVKLVATEENFQQWLRELKDSLFAAVNGGM